MKSWDLEHRTQRLWARDGALWTGNDEGAWMGWLTLVEEMIANLPDLQEFRHFKHVVLLGMGGSSLCAHVFQKTFGQVDGFPHVLVLDSTDPAQIRSCERDIDVDKTLFVVSSKSGTTLETQVLFDYFRNKAKHFIAISDPGTKLDDCSLGFTRIFHGVKSIGGRFSALSNFGLVPAALMGVDTSRVLLSAKRMYHACGPSVDAENNPGVQLGLFLGENSLCGRDKLTLLISPQICELGAWIEQLIAESTGKSGKGIVPIDKEPLVDARDYGSDRQFVVIKLENDSSFDTLTLKLSSAGHPVHTISCSDQFDLGAEFFRWEFATSVASSLLGVNPFDQPDVESTKVETRHLISHLENSDSVSADKSGLLAVKDLIASLSPGDYFGVCAFIEASDEHEKLLLDLRSQVRTRKHVATTHGFGPCYLHSTGQLHKGGPNSGAFLIITCDDEHDIQIPETKLTFGQIKSAQAFADMKVLVERGRRCAHYHIQGNVAEGLRALKWS